MGTDAPHCPSTWTSEHVIAEECGPSVWDASADAVRRFTCCAAWEAYD